MIRRTKIVTTLGPATSTLDSIKAIVGAGASVTRINGAHGTPEEHLALAEHVRSVSSDLNTTTAILVDLPGPKMRTGKIADGEAKLETGGTFTIVGEDMEGDSESASTTIPGLAEMLTEGDELFLADGEILLSVASVDGANVVTNVVRGGTLRSGKGLYVPGAERRIDNWTGRDEVAFASAERMKADFIGLSFVRSAEDVRMVLGRLPKKGTRPKLVAKIETRSSLSNLAEIIDAADAVMVARGDLGIQVDISRVPLLQKEIIHACNEAGKPVITATHMLESMVSSPLPTRAESTDIANAVLDGTDALMLSEETAIGKFPAEAVATMSKIALAAESWPRSRAQPSEMALSEDRVAWAVAHATIAAAEDLGCAAIICPTRTGSTARRVASYRPRMPVIGLSDRDDVLSSLSLVWGVTPLRIEQQSPPETEVRDCATTVLEAGLVQQGALVAVASGAAGHRAGSTDSLRVVRA